MDTWNLSKIYADDHALQQDIVLIKEYIKEAESKQKNVESSIQDLFELYEKSHRLMSKIYCYVAMKRDEDSTVSKSQKDVLEVLQIYDQLEQTFSFLKPYLLSLPTEKLEELKKNPGFENYVKTIDKMTRMKPYMLSEKEEKIVSTLISMAQTPQNDFYMLTNTDLKFGQVEGTQEELTNANFISFLLNNDREIREKAFKQLYAGYINFENTLASTLYNNIKNEVTLSKLRGFKSACEMELYSDNVSTRVYDHLIDTIHEYLPYLHRYYFKRKEMLNIEKNHMWDMYLPVTHSTKKYSFEEAQEMVIEAVAPLGEEYQNIMRKAFEENWIDRYPRKGKKSGAYSFGCYDSDPYILMNYTGDLDSVFTLIHELGHSIHSYYSRKNNRFLDAQYEIFVAEVASTFNENLLLDYLLRKAEDPEEKKHILNHHIDSFKSTVFRQTMFAEFEKITHNVVSEGKGLAAEDFKKIYADLINLYFGDAVAHDEEINNEWSRIPHFYSNFYVYKYATGFSCATLLSQEILAGNEAARQRYLQFLKDGGNHYPLDQLRSAGCDLENPSTLKKALNVFKQKVEEFETLE